MNTKPEDATRAESGARGPVVRAAWALLILMCIISVGWLDASVDPDVGFSLFYLLAVAAAAWRWGLGPAMAAACFSGVTRFVSGLIGRGSEAFLLVLWNSMNHLAVFLATGLFLALLRREISRSLRHNVPLCVGYLDLDNFKQVNDKYGHGTGDMLLQKIGDLFREAIRPEDLAARVGGDEFVLVFNSPGRWLRLVDKF